MITIHGTRVIFTGVTIKNGSITWDANGIRVTGCVIEATAKPK